MSIKLYNEDCLEGAKNLEDESADLIICDPPFGIGESTFNKHYKRDNNVVLDGYKEAPEDYYKFTLDWISQCKRILKPGGSFYIISGWSKLKDVLNAVDDNGLDVTNHIIWKYNFGVNTKKKFVTSHYHILYITKGKCKTFNTNCRFGNQEKNEAGGSLLYEDLEDVFYIKKEFHQNKVKNKNKLPDELIKKLILYSSNEGDVVLDLFMGNFTTAYVSRGLGRSVIGFEINKESYDYHIDKLKNMEYGRDLKGLKVVENIIPKNQGKTISEDERNKILNKFEILKNTYTKKKSIEILMEEFGRGKFSIINILK